MSRSAAYQHLQRVLSKWPVDNLRPECQFQHVMRQRLDRRFSSAEVEESAELQQANALYSLMENRYSKKYPIRGSLMKPVTNPTYYADLVRELDEAPSRSWWDRMRRRCKGMLRFR